VASFTAAADASAARPIVSGLRGFAESVLSFMPAGFAAYVRVFHPAYRVDGSRLLPVPWSKIAETNGKRAHPRMELEALTGSDDLHNQSQPGVFDSAPEVGRLPIELAAPLAGALARHTRTPDRCWFAVWAGWGLMRHEVLQGPVFDAPGREYHLVTGPINAIAELIVEYEPPAIWWPDDRAFCVATEIDLNTTYIGCDKACRDHILGRADIEAFAVEPIPFARPRG
jgi:hypothetical protein